MGRKVLVACDDSPHSRIMVDVAFSHVVKGHHDEIHLVNVYVPTAAATTVFPMAPVATTATVLALHHNVDQQRQADMDKARHTLKQISDLLVIDYKVPRDNIQTHVLLSEGGASGVSGAVLHFAAEHTIDLLVVGNRGMGSIKSSLMSLIGLGSVSDALIRSAPCPVVLVRWDPGHATAHAAEAQPPPLAPVSKRVCVSYDESPVSESAFLWALDNVLTQHDHLYVTTVMLLAPLPVLDEPAAVAAMQAQNARDQEEQAAQAAQAIVDKAVEIAVSHGVTRTKIIASVIRPTGGANDIGGALCTFAKEKAIDVMVVGCRGMGAVQRGLLSFIGLGSVSEYLAHHVHCALAVVHEGNDTAKDPARPTENLAFHVIPEGQDGEDEGETEAKES